MKDWLGVTIDVGDIIVYAVKESTRVAMNEAVVTGFGVKRDGYNGELPCVLAEWKRDNYLGETFRASNKVRLASPENITVIWKAPKEGQDGQHNT